VSRHDFAPWAIFWIACVFAFALVFGAIGCAAGAGGLRQACTNADTLMTGGYQLATASMKDAQRKGTAKALLGCFEDFVGSLDAGAKVKEATCTATNEYAAMTAKVWGAGAAVATAVAQWKSCSAKALGGL
jgi:hypothetical protein